MCICENLWQTIKIQYISNNKIINCSFPKKSFNIFNEYIFNYFQNIKHYEMDANVNH